jgi:hypothetical protein
MMPWHNYAMPKSKKIIALSGAGLFLLIGAGILLFWPVEISYRSNQLMRSPVDRIWNVLNSAGAQKRWFRSSDGAGRLVALSLSEGQENKLGVLRSLRFEPIGEWQETVTVCEPGSRLELVATSSGPFANLKFSYQLLPVDDGNIRLSIEYEGRLRGLANKWIRRFKIAKTLESTCQYSLLGIKALSGG